MTLWELILGFLIFLPTCIIAAALGFGGGLLAIPFLLLLNPEFAPVPLVLIAPFFSSLLAWRDRQAIDTSALWRTVVGLIPGVLTGALVLAKVNKETLGIVISLLLLAAIGLAATRVDLKPTSKTLLLGGTLSGFMANTVGMPGIPLAITMSHFEGPTLRSTMNTCVVMITTVSLGVLAFTNQIDGVHLVAAPVLLAAAIIGFFLSGPLRQVIDRQGITQFVYAIAVLGSLTLLVRSLT
ncbi:MAG: sulfite exporter TauE/SafE family protein [Acidimicrobiales bacterium]|nr:sulfite exporter TauE/SafE family protein [Acidimicrobiales bacterium]